MSKKSKTKAKEKRKNQKAARKAAQRALYESYMKQGKNTKSKRARKNEKTAKKVSAISHPDGKCGNPGCIRCFGIHYRPFLQKGVPYRMPHWMWMRWSELSKEEQKAAARR